MGVYQFKKWKSHDVMAIGLAKPTQLAMNYTQCRFHSSTGSPNPTSERAIRVNIEKVMEA